MAYLESSTITSRDALIQAIISFAVANAGFTDQGTSIDGSDTIYHMSKGSIYWNMLENDFTSGGGGTQYAILFRMSFAKITTVTAFNSTATAGQEYATTINCYANSGPYVKYFLYTDGNAVHCCLNVYTGVYTHVSLGGVIKCGTWTGGEYVTGSNSHQRYWASPYQYLTWNAANHEIIFDGGESAPGSSGKSGFIRHVVSTPSNDKYDFARLGSGETNDQQCKMSNIGDILDVLVGECSTNFLNMRAPLFPIWVNLLEEPTNRFMCRGYIPYARIVSVEHIPPETIVENDWICFPDIQRTGGDTLLAPISGLWGIAYKRVA